MKADKGVIRIRLDISIPLGGGMVDVQTTTTPTGTVGRGRFRSPPLILHPVQDGQTFARVSGTGHVICAFGTVGASVMQMWARVYELDDDLDEEPDPNSGEFTQGTLSGSQWEFTALPIAALPGTKQRLLVWSRDEDGVFSEGAPVEFTPVLSGSGYGSTYCELYPERFRQVARPVATDWSNLPPRWHFTLSGCSGAKCGNCAVLNGQWVLTRDAKASFLWMAPLPGAVNDAKQPAWWRLSLCHGYWYLESVGKVDQPEGVSISYRLHESAWNPAGANIFHLHTDSGYCRVPPTVTIYPG